MKNPFSGWTPAMVEAHNAKFAPKPVKVDTAVSLLAEAREREMKKKSQRLDPPPTPAFSIKPSCDEEKLNDTERAYLAALRRDHDVLWIGVQNITLKLGFDCRFTPDFCFLKNGVLTFVDTKGGHVWEDSIIKIKTAARMFPWATFMQAQFKGGVWKEKKFRP